MKTPQRKPNRIESYDYSQIGAYFVTICTQNRMKILSKLSVGTPLPGCPQEPVAELLWHGKIADQFIQQLNAFYLNLSVDKYVIMPDHIHFFDFDPRCRRTPGDGCPYANIGYCTFCRYL